MAVLLAVNESLLNGVVVDEDRIEEIIKSVMEMCEFDAKDDLGIDFEARTSLPKTGNEKFHEK